MRMGLLGRSGAGACPNLPQRRSGPGSAARRSAEYQRFSFGAPARSGSLWQIWTTCAAAGPSEGRRRADSGRGGRPPDAETCISHSKAQFQSLFSRVKCTSRRGRGRSWLVRTAAPIPPRDIPSELAGKAQLCWWVFLWLVGAGSVMRVMVPVGGAPPCRGFPFFCRPASRRRCRWTRRCRPAGRRVRRCRAVSRRPARRRCLVRRVGGGAPGGARWRWRRWCAGRWRARAVAGRPRR